MTTLADQAIVRLALVARLVALIRAAGPDAQPECRAVFVLARVLDAPLGLTVGELLARELRALESEGVIALGRGGEGRAASAALPEPPPGCPQYPVERGG